MTNEALRLPLTVDFQHPASATLLSCNLRFLAIDSPHRTTLAAAARFSPLVPGPIFPARLSSRAAFYSGLGPDLVSLCLVVPGVFASSLHPVSTPSLPFHTQCCLFCDCPLARPVCAVLLSLPHRPRVWPPAGPTCPRVLRYVLANALLLRCPALFCRLVPVPLSSSVLLLVPIRLSV